MADNFSSHSKGMSSPADVHYAITPSDSTDLPRIPRGLRVLTSGNLAIRDRLGTDITYPVVAGEVLAFRGVRILFTGTTATVVGWE